MKKKMLRNSLRRHLITHFRGRDITFKSKSTQTFNIEDEEEFDKYQHWLKIYGGLIYDCTPPEWDRGETQ